MTVRYTDSKGRVHEVDSIRDVPQRYTGSMEVVGDSADDTETSSGGFSFGSGKKSAEMSTRGTNEAMGVGGDLDLRDVGPGVIIAVVLTVCFIVFKSWVVRLLIFVAAFIVGIFFVTSGVFDDSKEIMSQEDKQLEAEIGDAAKKKKSTWKDIKNMLDEREGKRAEKSLKAGEEAGTNDSE